MIAEVIADYITRYLEAQLASDWASRAQVVVVGPPHSILDRVFDTLTGRASHDPDVSGERAPVLLVQSAPVAGPTADRLSQRCTWDYAVAIRNSARVSVTLVDPEQWDWRPESIANAVETIGKPRAKSRAEFFADPLWRHVAATISNKIGSTDDIVIRLLSVTFDDFREVEPCAAVWCAADRIMSVGSFAEACREIGLPRPDEMENQDQSLLDSLDVLRHFARQCAAEGLTNLESRLCGISVMLSEDGVLPELSTDLRNMFRQLRATAGSGVVFASRPTEFFRPMPDSDAWWFAVTALVLSRLMEGAGNARPIGKLEVRCPDALNVNGRSDSEPFLVQDTPRLRVLTESGDVVIDPVVHRRITPKNAVALVADHTGLVVDLDVPKHHMPLSYRVDSAGRRGADIDLIALVDYSLGAFLKVIGAVRNPAPVWSKSLDAYEQSVTVSHSGIYTAAFFFAPDVTQISIISDEREIKVDMSSPLSPLELDDGDSLAISVAFRDGRIAEWSLSVVVVDATDELPRTRLEALIQANQAGRPSLPLVRPADGYVRALEDAYVTDPESWRPLHCCWSKRPASLPQIWNEVWANVHIPVIPSPSTLTAPQRFLAARKGICSLLRLQSRNMCEVDFASDEYAQLASEYLSAYESWLKEDSAAVWSDTICIYAPLWNAQAGRVIATHEPVAVLMSPIHPVRFAWLVQAQRTLASALQTKPCPAAGLIQPHLSPGVMAFPLMEGTRVEWRSFFASSCDAPYWGLLWSEEYLEESDERSSVSSFLRQLGIAPSGITGSFSAAQTRKALNDTWRLLPARATLRVGIVGANSEADDCAQGILQWCQEQFASGTRELSGLPARCEVYDHRGTAPASAALVSEVTEAIGERLGWFSVQRASVPYDLTIIDQLGLAEPKGAQYSSRSIAAESALFRINIREDHASASILSESRISSYAEAGSDLGNLINSVTSQMERFSVDYGSHISHLEFRPNKDAISERLSGALFVAATSRQVDPAFFVRGLSDARAYLWDFELPGVDGFDNGRGGYYLLANPPTLVKEGIEKASRFIAPSPPQADDILKEISARGIPVLKKLAGGGSMARGEIGVLLAVRLLQDAFRSHGSGVRLPVSDEQVINMLLSIDSYWEPILRLRKGLMPGSSEERPDVLVFSIAFCEHGPVRIKITPTEVKLREHSMSQAEKADALKQARNLAGLLNQVWVEPLPNDLWETCARALLAQCLDQCFRVYSGVHSLPEEVWVRRHEQALSAVLSGMAEITVATEGRLIVIDTSSLSSIEDINGDGRLDSAVINRLDAEPLLSGGGPLSEPAQSAVRLLDFAVQPCDHSMDSGGAAAKGSYPEVTPTVHPNVDSDPVESEVDDASPQTTAIPSEVRVFVRQAFEGFIGNASAVKRISNDLLKALVESPPHLSKNYLFTGQPSTGKTELARRMARALQLPFIALDGRSVGSRERLFELVRAELNQQDHALPQIGQQAGLPIFQYPAFVVLIDEVHLLQRAVQESLLTMLEAADRRATLNDHIAVVTRATFLFATTRSSEIDAAFRSRCTEIALKEYATDEVAEIVRLQIGKSWSKELCLRVAELGRSVPRVALELARELIIELEVTDSRGLSIMEHLDEVRKARDLDTKGLTSLDRQYLGVLRDEGRPLGEQAIQNMIGTVDKERIVDEVEPFLRRLGFIRLGSRGRELTEAGHAYLSATP